ncbi:uncharacterized protein LOC121370205 [Gigantopelta aegis]|uniref:uncharacterized protein LOC121370205 n=1 Tax=Gigantopelta aegis TaxID=1735272 RepID=UPI001B887FDA|nr:uncharacterized protein LOC121370205 [Gigantopelta aegis]
MVCSCNSFSTDSYNHGLSLYCNTFCTSSYNHVNTEWLVPYRDGSPPEKYFCSTKLSVWANVADQVQEAVRDCHQMMAPYFEKTHRDIVAQITGQVVFDALGQSDIQGVRSITDTVSEGLRLLGLQQNVKPLEFLGKYLLEQSGATEITMTTEKLKESQLSASRQYGDPGDEMDRLDQSDGENVKEQTELDEDDEDGDFRGGDNPATDDETQKDEGQEKNERQVQDESNTLRQTHRETLLLHTQSLSRKFGTMRATKSKRLSAEELANHPEKRTPVAFEILTSEIEYNRMLKAIRDVFVRPLKSALSSNSEIEYNRMLKAIRDVFVRPLKSALSSNR